MTAAEDFADMTLGEVLAYANREAEMVARRVALDERRREYLDRLTAAAGGDESMTWEAAHALLPDDEPEALP